MDKEEIEVIRESLNNFDEKFEDNSKEMGRRWGKSEVIGRMLYLSHLKSLLGEDKMFKMLEDGKLELPDF